MLRIKPFKQTDDSRCGPACIKMVLDYYGIKKTEDEICVQVGHTYEKGCTDYQIKAALEYYGLYPVIHNNSTIEDLRFWVKSKIPVIVDWFTPGYQRPDKHSMPNGHSSIVLGFKDNDIVLLDPEMGDKRLININEFLRVWFDWRHDPYIQSWDDMIIRQAIPVYNNYSIFK